MVEGMVRGVRSDTDRNNIDPNRSRHTTTFCDKACLSFAVIRHNIGPKVVILMIFRPFRDSWPSINSFLPSMER
jgi:hypothetical protein